MQTCHWSKDCLCESCRSAGNRRYIGGKGVYNLNDKTMQQHPQDKEQPQKGWVERFRKMIIENSDLHPDYYGDKPFKGDIYFDGIEVEAFIAKEIEEAERKVLKLLKAEIDKEIIKTKDENLQVGLVIAKGLLIKVQLSLGIELKDL